MMVYTEVTASSAGDLGADLGFCLAGGAVFWLLQGQRDRGADQVEGVPLGGGRLGSFPDYNLTDFLRGVTIPVSKGSTVDASRLGTFFYQEDQLVERLDGFCKLLNRCRSFSQETVVEFPREDDAVDVRVKNTVRTSF